MHEDDGDEEDEMGGGKAILSHECHIWRVRMSTLDHD